MSKMLMNFVRDESGQDLAEYALLLVLIAVAVIAVFPALAKAISGAFEDTTDYLDGTKTPGSGT